MAATWTGVPDAAIRPSLITHAETGTAPSVKPTPATNGWLNASEDLLPVPYFHVVFTIPHELSALALQNKKSIYNLLFRASAETLLEVAGAPNHLGPPSALSAFCIRGDRISNITLMFIALFLQGGLTPDHSVWRPSPTRSLLPVRVLSKVFRGKFYDGLKRLFRRGELTFHGLIRNLAEENHFRSFLRILFRNNWVVYAKRPFKSAEHVLQYLARYTHRVAISNHRLIEFKDNTVTFRWKDYAHGNKKRKMAVSADEFLRRFLLHLLPRGFVRIRHFGFLAARSRTRLVPLCRELLSNMTPCCLATAPSAAALSLRCPHCAGPMVVIERLTAQQIRLRSLELASKSDTS